VVRKIRVIEQTPANKRSSAPKLEGRSRRSIAGQLKSHARKVSCEKDTYHQDADAPVENAHSATPFSIGRRVSGRAFEVERFAHCRLSTRETLGTTFGQVARYRSRQGGTPIVAVALFGSTVIAYIAIAIPMMTPTVITNDVTSKEGFVRWSELNIASSSDFIRYLLNSFFIDRIDWAHNEQSGFYWL
jgi:hypothetical protein